MHTLIRTGGFAPVAGDIGTITVGTAFGSRYHIIKVLGVGGMGAVYQAWDAELGMAVAVKVIRPEASADPAAARDLERRFKQELVLARKVTHKNVVRIHDMGEINGIKYLTMPYLDGSDLATVLKERGKLDVPAALAIIRDVAAGLQAAHEAGIVHRDLKPANVMVLADHAIIMDFGIARSAAALPPASEIKSAIPPSMLGAAPEATMIGMVLGTLEYMAPEQVNGQPVDQRADLYALGLIFSDLLLGARKITNPVADVMERVKTPPPPVRTLDATIPEPIERIICRCLEPDPAARFQTSAELVTELNRLDERGAVIPIRRVVGLPFVAAVVIGVTALSAAGWWYARPTPPAPAHAPLSVMIADVTNGTGDATLSRTLEPMLKMALEEASFISAYDRTQVRTLGVAPVRGELDEEAARKIAVAQGLGAVVSGSMQPDGEGYRLSLKAVRAVTGDPIVTAEGRAASRTDVLRALTQMAVTLRKGLGDDTSESQQRFAMETLTTSSLEAVHQYAGAMDALSNGRFEDARRLAVQATSLDPDFGSAYGVAAVAANNLDDRAEADKYAKLALAHLNRMTERERFRTRGLSFYLGDENSKCIQEYTALIAKYAADASAHNNLALCSARLHRLDVSVREAQMAASILPRRALYRANTALYAAYAGDFGIAEREAAEAQTLNPTLTLGVIAQAFIALGQGRSPEAANAYATLEKLSPSEGVMGLGDLAIYEGRLKDAVRLLERGAASDLAEKNTLRAGDKLTALAYAQLAQGQPKLTIATASRALDVNAAAKTRFLAARLLIEAGDARRVQPVIADLANQLNPEPQAYAKILEGDAALRDGRTREAVKALTEANALVDSWIGHFDLGRAYFAAGAYLEADAEFDGCLKRKGEALSIGLDAAPTAAYLPSLYYYLGRVREAQNIQGYADFYRTYLDIRGAAAEDSLLPDVRRRLP